MLLDLWASRLPPHAQAAVIASRGDAADKTTIADAIVDSMDLRNIHSIDTKGQQKVPTPRQPAQCSFETLQHEIAQLTSKLEQVLSSHNGSGFRAYPRSRSRSASRGAYAHRSATPVDEVCWYHRTYGNEALRCRKPCSFSQSSSSGAANKQ